MFTRKTVCLFVLGSLALSGCSRSSSPIGVGTSELPASREGKRERGSDTIAGSCSYTGKSHATLDGDLTTIELTLCSEHFASGSDARAAVVAMVGQMNAFRTSLEFVIGDDESHTDYDATFAEDGVFKVDFVDPDDCTADDCVFDGRALTRKNSSGDIVEFDLGFDADKTWYFAKADSWELSDGNKHFKTIFLHEITHGIGFPHVLNATEDLSVMGHKTGKWNAIRRPGLKAFDVGHMVHHYPDSDSEPRPDLVLANYSTYYESSDEQWKTQLNSCLSSPFVASGSNVTVSWTEMNRGRAFPADFAYRIYLSEDEALDSDDHEVHTFSRTFRRFPSYATEYGLSATCSVPTDVPDGLWYVLVAVDTEDSVDEFEESNNTLALHKQLLVLSRGSILNRDELGD